MASLTHPPEFQSLFFHGCPSRCKCPRIAGSWTMNKEVSLQPSLQLSIPAPLAPRVETSRFCDLRFDRLQPSDEELDQHSRFEFGHFVARQALLDQEYWTAAWLRAESQWENRTCGRYVDHYKRNFAEEVRKEQKNVKRSILKSVVGTLDLSVRYLLIGETFPGERPNAPSFCNIIRTPSSRYGYIANLCVAKSARRQGIASNMMYFAVESAKSTAGVARIYVHVDRDNKPAQTLYQNLGFEMVEMANSLLLDDQKYLLLLQT